MTTVTAPSLSIDHGLLPTIAGFNMRRAYFIATQIFAEHFAAFEITPIQFGILEIVARNDCLSQKEIAAHIGTAPSVIVRPIRDLEQSGIVERTRDQNDRRNHQIRLTTAGRVAQSAMRNHIFEVEEALLHALTSEERGTLVALLNKVVDSHQ